MAAPVLLSDLITRVVRRANLENFVGESGTFVTKPEVRDYINEVAAELYDELVAARGQEFYRKSFTLATSANVPTYPLPADFYELLSIDVYIAPNQVLSARPYMESERNRFRWYPGWFYNMPIYFRMQGVPQSTSAVLVPGNISLIPTPAAANQVVLNYYPTFTPWATDGTQDNYAFDGVNGWEAFIVWKVAAFCMEKKEESSEFHLARAAEILARIRAMAVDREAGDAERVHDVSADIEPFSWGGGWGV